jgi:hypothetical protein
MSVSIDVLDFLLLVPAGYVLLGCICRLNLMEPGSSAWAWRAVYLALAAWTGHVAADLAAAGAVPLRDALGVLAMALYVHLTRRRWANGVPEVAQCKREGA